MAWLVGLTEPHTFHHPVGLLGLLPMVVVVAAREAASIHSAFQAFACIMLASISLLKTCPMANLRVKFEGTQTDMINGVWIHGEEACMAIFPTCCIGLLSKINH